MGDATTRRYLSIFLKKYFTVFHGSFPQEKKSSQYAVFIRCRLLGIMDDGLMNERLKGQKCLKKAV